jgi:trans-2,3-dihydro-3-hydroxyanthranilate isomerase
MAGLPFALVDAFTERPLTGNACAVVLDADALDSETMQAVAREMNLSETAFVIASDTADFGARYFTPGAEIPMAGHPTLATVRALVDAGRVTLSGPVTRVTLSLPAGLIPVDVQTDEGVVTGISMTQLRPEFLAGVDLDEALAAFGLDATDGGPGPGPQVVSTGTPQLMIPVSGLEPLRRLRPDWDACGALAESTGFFSFHLFCTSGATAAGRTFARHFAGPPNCFEDPFTGSATGAMAAYLWHHGLVEAPAFVAEQGHWLSRPGRALVERVGPADAIEGVRVGGQAVVVVRGELDL